MQLLKPEETLNADVELAKQIAEFYADPLGHVIFSYPWDSNKLIQQVPWGEERRTKGFEPIPAKYRDRYNTEFGPDLWACDFLEELGQEIRARGFDGINAVDAIRESTASGHGIGKSVLVAWLIKFIMDTRPFCRGTVTANTDTQLRTKTWATLEFWHQISATRHWFNLSTGRGAMALRHRDHPGTWFTSAQTSREENSESFAGQHAANSTSFYIFDEASGIPDKIYEVRQGGLTEGEPMVFDFGNPTKNSGAFYENTFGKQRHRYIARSIDSRNVYLSNKKNIQEWLEDNGEESDFFKVRVRGIPPSMGSGQFIKSADVEDAGKRPIHNVRGAQLVIGVDCSAGGHETVIYPRLGNDARSWGCERHRTDDDVFIVNRITSMVKRFHDLGIRTVAIAVDDTGGYGKGICSMLENMGYPVVRVKFSHKAHDTIKYRFRGDEMWGRMRDAMSKDLAILEPRDKDGIVLKDQLTQREYTNTIKQQIWLEPKKLMQKRLGGDSSPDVADALALTFFETMVGIDLPANLERNEMGGKVVHEYDPLNTDF